MKKQLILIIMIVITVLSLVACNKKTEGSNNVTTNANTQYISSGITKEDYCVIDSLENTKNNDTKLYSNSKNPQKYGLMMLEDIIGKKLEDVKAKRKVNFVDGEFEYKKSTYKYLNDEKKEFGYCYSVYDVYTNDGDKIKFLNGTDIMCAYSMDDDEAREHRGKNEIDLDKARKIAENFIKEVSNIDLQEYTYQYWEDFPYADYVFRYSRCINGYDTDDIIIIEVASDGTVVTYAAKNIGKYETLVDNLTKEKLDSTRIRLNSKIQSNSDGNMELKGEPVLITNTYGEVFLSQDVIISNSIGAVIGISIVMLVE